MFKKLTNGICSFVKGPVYGLQDVGISPAGVMDRFSYWSGNILLDNAEDSPCFEIIFPIAFEAEEDMFFILTGAATSGSVIKSEGKLTIVEHGRVYRILKGQQLSIGNRIYGFRTYLCFRKYKACFKKLEGRKYGEFKKVANWQDPDNCIRVIRGPEYKYLENPEEFLKNYWIVSQETSNMGMKLDGLSTIKVNLENMISEPVADGTIQFTIKGPIVLLRHRQTVGGYPRGFNVISCDLDMLAQYFPGQVIRFKEVTIEEGIYFAKTMMEDLNRLRKKFK